MTEDEVRAIVREEIKNALARVADDAIGETAWNYNIVETTALDLISRHLSQEAARLDEGINLP